MLDIILRHCTDSYLFLGRIVVAEFTISEEIPRTTTRTFLKITHTKERGELQSFEI